MDDFRLRLGALLALAAPLLTLSPLSAATHHARASVVAPADEYFGPLKMSILGIQNTLRDTTFRVDHFANADAGKALRTAQFVEKSLRDWEAKYPRDNWLPRMVFALHHLYAKLPPDVAQEHPNRVAAWLVRKYPHSPEARRLRTQLANTEATL